MRVPIVFLWLGVAFSLYLSCKKPTPNENYVDMTAEFFQTYIPEMSEVRLLEKADLPERQQRFFEEADGQLQLLADLNGNNIPEYFVTGISEASLRNHEKTPFFIAIFERSNNQVSRLYFQQVFIPPVNLSYEENDNTKRVIISFAFYSGFGASLFYQDSTYQLEQW
ncbi:hypothetical protein JW960_28885 [candidate division KSB1 bacterium]|nr:hypothetical protein [candidate division KSB1 bacterium]